MCTICTRGVYRCLTVPLFTSIILVVFFSILLLVRIVHYVIEVIIRIVFIVKCHVGFLYIVNIPTFFSFGLSRSPLDYRWTSTRVIIFIIIKRGIPIFFPLLFLFGVYRQVIKWRVMEMWNARYLFIQYFQIARTWHQHMKLVIIAGITSSFLSMIALGFTDIVHVQTKITLKSVVSCHFHFYRWNRFFNLVIFHFTQNFRI